MTPNELIQSGTRKYIEGKNKGMEKLGFQITDVTPYLSSDEKQRKDLGKVLSAVPDLVKKIERWKELTDKFGTEAE